MNIFAAKYVIRVADHVFVSYRARNIVWCVLHYSSCYSLTWQECVSTEHTHTHTMDTQKGYTTLYRFICTQYEERWFQFWNKLRKFIVRSYKFNFITYKKYSCISTRFIYCHYAIQIWLRIKASDKISVAKAPHWRWNE